MFQSWTQRVISLFDLFLETNCPICQRSTSQILCRSCQHQIQKCQLQSPIQERPGLPLIFAWGIYQGQLKQAITRLKYENQPDLAIPLGQWLGQSWLDQGCFHQPPNLPRQLMTVVPIPLHPERQQQRGYNQAERLAAHFCQVTGYRLNAHLLRRVRKTQAQFRLSAAERKQNLNQAFAPGPGMKQYRRGSAVLLLDDIYTSGSTIRSALQVLEQQRIPVRGIVTLSVTQQAQ